MVFFVVLSRRPVFPGLSLASLNHCFTPRGLTVTSNFGMLVLSRPTSQYGLSQYGLSRPVLYLATSPQSHNTQVHFVNFVNYYDAFTQAPFCRADPHGWINYFEHYVCKCDFMGNSRSRCRVRHERCWKRSMAAVVQTDYPNKLPTILLRD